MQFGTTFKWTYKPTGERLSTYREHKTQNGATRNFNALRNNEHYNQVSFETKNTKNETVAHGGSE